VKEAEAQRQQGEASHLSPDPVDRGGPQGGVRVPTGMLLLGYCSVESVSFTVWKQTQSFYCFVLKLSGFSWLRLWKKERFMCSEEKLALTVGKCTVDVGKLNNQVGVRDFGT